MNTQAVIDLQKLGSKELNEFHRDELLHLGKQLVKTAQSCGFVAFRNHGLHLDFVNELHAATGKFFDLPVEEKMKSRRSTETFQGYSNGIIENLNEDNSKAVDFKETFNSISLDYDFPEKVPEIKQATAPAYEILWPFVLKLFNVVELGMGWELGVLENLHSKHPNGVTTLRTLKYPPVPETKTDFIRCGAHKDYTIFTLQFQSNIGGFEILHDNQWKNADSDPENITFFFGESMELLSGDQIQAAKHRVVVTDEEAQRRYTRLSMAFFVHSDIQKELYTISGPNKYAPMYTHEFLQNKLHEVNLGLLKR